MESDYEEVVFEPVVSEMSTNQDDIIKMLMAISNQMMMIWLPLPLLTNQQFLQVLLL